MEVHNIASLTDLGCQLNLKDIKLKVPKAKYNPHRFSGLSLKIDYPKATAQLFGTGKMVCVGTKSVADLDLAGKEFCRLLTYLGYPTIFNGFTITNMVASCDVGFKICLEPLNIFCKGVYEPELFPGMKLKI